MNEELLAERISHERELREAERSAYDHEREVRRIADAHERELRLQTEAAVEKARELQYKIYEVRLEQMNEFRGQLTTQAATFMTVDRFEREHSALIERVEASMGRIGEKVLILEKSTVRVAATDDVKANMSANNRWLIALVLGNGLTLIALLSHLMGIVK